MISTDQASATTQSRKRTRHMTRQRTVFTHGAAITAAGDTRYAS